MSQFEISSEFLMDNRPFKILSGAIHYFRVHPTDWYHSLYNLKALGFNTVETYVPWNMHETVEGQFDFSEILDIEKFIQIAQSLDLYVIVRPSPYICAEWEFGGFPAWLLEKNCKIRSSDEKYLKYVGRYYDILMKKLVPLQSTQGGPIIMIQIENEYGSYGEDKEYLAMMEQMMMDRGIEVPFVTSDGSWEAALAAGSMIEEDILPTGNFGSRGKENFEALKKFHEKYNKNWPLMCMEFWCGWFNRWGEPIVKRSTSDLIESLKEVLELGSINIYMFHGGTNFGFMNGCSARGTTDLPQITSYDYGAPLDERGNPTEKYYAIQKLIHEMFPEISQKEPLEKSSFSQKDIPLKTKVCLFEVLDAISDKKISRYPKRMEELGQNYGYLLYRTQFTKEAEEEDFRIIDGRDRAQIFLNEEYVTTQYQHEIGDKIFVQPNQSLNQLDVLVENMGRVNYGHKLLSETQHKGLRQGVMKDLHFLLDWEQYSLDFSKVNDSTLKGKWKPQLPAFYRFTFTLKEVQDTYLNLENFGKGIVLVNGTNIGRFWDKGPTLSLYIPHGLLHDGENEIIVFETEGRFSEKLSLEKHPVFKEIELEEE